TPEGLSSSPESTRLKRELLIKGTTISSNVSGRSPEEMVKAVNSATEANIAVAARLLDRLFD
ncbi:hypothetical protein E4U57_003109, partial [Claviceps arundinis]